MGKPLVITIPKGQKCQCPIHQGAVDNIGLWYKNKDKKWYCPSCVKTLIERKLKNGTNSHN